MKETEGVPRVAPRLLRLQRSVGVFGAAFQRGDVLVVMPGARPEGGEIVIDMDGRVGRHGGGPVWGIVVGAVRQRALKPPAKSTIRANPRPT